MAASFFNKVYIAIGELKMLLCILKSSFEQGLHFSPDVTKRVAGGVTGPQQAGGMFTLVASGV